MKNCEVIIQTFEKTTKTACYQFNDYRIASALSNLLDNVGEPHMEGDTDYFEWLPIDKKLNEEKK